MKWFLIFLHVVVIVKVTTSAKVLCVFPIPFKSHQIVLRILSEELAKQGHQVVLATPYPNSHDTDNLTEIDIGMVNTKYDSDMQEATKDLTTFSMQPYDFSAIGYYVYYPIIDIQLREENLQKLVQNATEYFDLILTEEVALAATVIGARFNAPIVVVSSFFSHHNTHTHLGSEAHPLLFPYKQKRPDSFWESFSIFFEYLRLKWLISSLPVRDNELIRKHFGEKAPPIEEVRKNRKLATMALHPMWDSCRAVTTSVIYMGAIHLKETKPLPQDLKSFLDNSKNGVIYMSLGSKLRSSALPPHILKVILKVFSSLPYDVLWKWDDNQLPHYPPNVRLEKWLPQADLLYHQAIKLFICQGGVHSSDESIAAGVPLLGLPVFADQHQNVQKYKEYGIGESLDIDTLDEEEFRRTILHVAEDQTYCKNIHRLSRIMSDQRTDGVKLALHRIQRLLEHGVPFPPAAADVTPADYFMLDVFVPLLLSCLFILTTAILVLRRIFY